MVAEPCTERGPGLIFGEDVCKTPITVITLCGVFKSQPCIVILVYAASLPSQIHCTPNYVTHTWNTALKIFLKLMNAQKC